MFGHIANYENFFFIDGKKVIGIEDLSITYSNSPKIFNPLGPTNGVTLSSGPTTQQASFTRNMLFDDPLLAYTGMLTASGSFHYGANIYGFKSGSLNEYMVNCAVGTVPKITTNFSIYDEMVSSTKNASGAISPPTVYPVDQGSISIICDNYTSNRVVGFDLAVSKKEAPIYRVGNKNPVEIVLVEPLSFSATVQIDVDDAVLKNAWHFLDEKSNKTVSLSVKSKDKTQDLFYMPIPNASLISETLTSNGNGGVKLTLNYIGHL